MRDPTEQYYDNPWTALNETADNGKYILWGNSTRAVSWEGAAFPAVLANCQSCHTGSGADVDNWKSVPSRAACGSCHDAIDWATGVNHAGGVALSDGFCAVCHPATGNGFGQSVTTAHNWTDKDIRNKPEFNIALTTDTPARGYYVNGESPVISIALTDSATGAVIVPSTVIQDDNGSEGCLPLAGSEGTLCNVPRDGFFTAANVYVTGPRGQRIPALGYGARAKVTSASAGPWNLSAGINLGLIVDGGMSMLAYNDAPAYEGYGADELITGAITVPFVNSFFADNAAATPAEVAAWLNANTTFNERAIAYVENYPATNVVNRLSIRSRGLLQKGMSGDVVKVTAQPSVSIVGTGGGIFANNAFGTAGGAAQARIRPVASTSATDPKANFSDPTKITYTLDPVDDLVPGTYVINVEFADASRGPGNPPEPPFVNYRTPSVAVATFQVKTATVEKPIADGCTACHWSDAGIGFVLDNPRHNKPFGDNAVDQCGGCHDYASAQNPADYHAGFLRRGPPDLQAGARGAQRLGPHLPDHHGSARGDFRLRPQLADHLPDGYPQLRVLPLRRRDQRHLEDQPQPSGLHGLPRHRCGDRAHEGPDLRSDAVGSMERRRAGIVQGLPLMADAAER